MSENPTPIIKSGETKLGEKWRSILPLFPQFGRLPQFSPNYFRQIGVEKSRIKSMRNALLPQFPNYIPYPFYREFKFIGKKHLYISYRGNWGEIGGEVLGLSRHSRKGCNQWPITKIAKTDFAAVAPNRYPSKHREPRMVASRQVKGSGAYLLQNQERGAYAAVHGRGVSRGRKRVSLLAVRLGDREKRRRVCREGNENLTCYPYMECLTMSNKRPTHGWQCESRLKRLHLSNGQQKRMIEL